MTNLNNARCLNGPDDARFLNGIVLIVRNSGVPETVIRDRLTHLVIDTPITYEQAFLAVSQMFVDSTVENLYLLTTWDEWSVFFDFLGNCLCEGRSWRYAVYQTLTAGGTRPSQPGQ